MTQKLENKNKITMLFEENKGTLLKSKRQQEPTCGREAQPVPTGEPVRRLPRREDSAQQQRGERQPTFEKSSGLGPRRAARHVRSQRRWGTRGRRTGGGLPPPAPVTTHTPRAPGGKPKPAAGSRGGLPGRGRSGKQANGHATAA